MNPEQKRIEAWHQAEFARLQHEFRCADWNEAIITLIHAIPAIGFFLAGGFASGQDADWLALGYMLLAVLIGAIGVATHSAQAGLYRPLAFWRASISQRRALLEQGRYKAMVQAASIETAKTNILHPARDHFPV
jgi:hypothetical protein